MSFRKTKAEIITLLGRDSWEDVKRGLEPYGHQRKLHALFSALCNSNELIKWHAVSGFGVVVADIADQDMEAARVVMRRFLWTLNDESGGIGWGVPEAMAEVMSHHDNLFEEYYPLLLSYMHEDGPEPFQDGNFLELPALQRGVLWGVGRLLSTRKKELDTEKIAREVDKYLDSTDPIVRALAICCLGIARYCQAIDRIAMNVDDHYEFALYQEHRLHTVTTGSLAHDALKILKEKC